VEQHDGLAGALFERLGESQRINILALPLLGLFETPNKLPGSIAESVLGKMKGGSAAAVGAAAASEPNTKG
jgi:hypothetical protein